MKRIVRRIKEDGNDNDTVKTKQSSQAALVIFTESLRKKVKEYSDIFNKYRSLLQESDLPLIKSNHLEEAEETVLRTSKAKEVLHDLNECLLRITKDIMKLQSILRQNYAYSQDQIDIANSNFVDLAGVSSMVNTRYSQLSNKDILLSEIHSDFLTDLQLLNQSIIEYNQDKTNHIYTIPEAVEIFNRNTPGLF
jgi:hypothetical protein